MADIFREFQKFDHQEEADQVAKLLAEAKIPYEIEIAQNYLDSVIIGNISPPQQVVLKLQPDDFQKADQVLEAEAATWLDQIPDDYHLFEFTDEELTEILEKADEWSKEDYLLAQKILKDRGYKIDHEYLEELKEYRLKASRKAQDASPTLIASGFLSLLLAYISIALGSNNFELLPNKFWLLVFCWPLVLGAYLWRTTKTDMLGQRYYYYTSPSRNWGMRLILSVVISAAVITVMTVFYLEKAP